MAFFVQTEVPEIVEKVELESENSNDSNLTTLPHG